MGEKYVRRVKKNTSQEVISASHIPRDRGGGGGKKFEETQRNLVDFLPLYQKCNHTFQDSTQAKYFLIQYLKTWITYFEDIRKNGGRRKTFRKQKDKHYSIHRLKKGYHAKCAAYEEGNWTEDE